MEIYLLITNEIQQGGCNQYQRIFGNMNSVNEFVKKHNINPLMLINYESDMTIENDVKSFRVWKNGNNLCSRIEDECSQNVCLIIPIKNGLCWENYISIPLH